MALDINKAQPERQYDTAKNIADSTVLAMVVCRLLVARSDGNGTYDSSEDDSNNFNQMNDKSINENHNNRPSMMLA